MHRLALFLPAALTLRMLRRTSLFSVRSTTFDDFKTQMALRLRSREQALIAVYIKAITVTVLSVLSRLMINFSRPLDISSHLAGMFDNTLIFFFGSLQRSGRRIGYTKLVMNETGSVLFHLVRCRQSLHQVISRCEPFFAASSAFAVRVLVDQFTWNWLQQSLIERMTKIRHRISVTCSLLWKYHSVDS